MAFPLPVIKDEALQKFCKQHNLYEAIAAGYHYAQKFFPKARKIEIEFHPPYRDDEPEEAEIVFIINSNMAVDAVVEAREQFINSTLDIPGTEYIATWVNFISHESS